jgi:putative ABC transport system ATP-binding protein
VVFQFFQLLPTLTVRENVELPMELLGEPGLEARVERARALLDQVGVLDQEEKFPGQLSGGQQQRVAIARALANHPTLLVADEPTGNLDSTTADNVMSLLRSLVDQGRTLVLVSHDQEARRFADREVLIEDGRLQPSSSSVSPTIEASGALR